MLGRRLLWLSNSRPSAVTCPSASLACGLSTFLHSLHKQKKGALLPGEHLLRCTGCENLRLRLPARLCFGVMLFVVDILRRGVLFPVDLLLFASRELPAIRGAVCLNLLVDAFLLIFQLRRLSCRQCPLFTPRSDAVLLVLAPLCNFVVAITAPCWRCAGPDKSAWRRRFAACPPKSRHSARALHSTARAPYALNSSSTSAYPDGYTTPRTVAPAFSNASTHSGVRLPFQYESTHALTASAKAVRPFPSSTFADAPRAISNLTVEDHARHAAECKAVLFFATSK
jgi:hypothetical protein